VVTLVVIGNFAKEMDREDYRCHKIMLTARKAQLNNPQRTSLLRDSNYKSLAETASFRGINKALLGVKTGINVISHTNNGYTSVKNRRMNPRSKKVVTYSMAN